MSDKNFFEKIKKEEIEKLEIVFKKSEEHRSVKFSGFQVWHDVIVEIKGKLAKKNVSLVYSCSVETMSGHSNWGVSYNKRIFCENYLIRINGEKMESSQEENKKIFNFLFKTKEGVPLSWEI